VVLLYEARVANSLLGNFIFVIGLQCWALPDLKEIFRPQHISALQGVHCKNCLTFCKDDGYH